MRDKDAQNWNRLVTDGLNYDGDTNTRHEFGKMSKMFGKAYLEYLAAAYSAKDFLTDAEFCGINGNVPIGFLKKLGSLVQ